MPRLDIYVNFKLSASIKVADADLVLGRDVRCDVQIPDPRVSRKHAIISAVDGGHEIENLGGNGTVVNESPVTGSKRLFPGDAIIISDYILTYQSDDVMPANVAATVMPGG